MFSMDAESTTRRSSSAPHVTIVGGGITGLAAAYYLQQRCASNGEPVTYTLLESAPRLGGKIVTHQKDGFVLESGPDSFITQKPWALELCRDLGIEEQLIPCNEKYQKAYLVHDGVLASLPMGSRFGVPTRWGPFLQSPLLSPWGKLRVAMEFLIPRGSDTADESISSILSRRLGREACRNIAGPLLAGLYVADPDRLSLLATYPMLRDQVQQHGSLLRGFRRADKARGGTSTGPLFVSFPAGMSALVDRLEQVLIGRIRRGVHVSALQARREDGYYVHTEGDNGTVLKTDAVLLAGPAAIAADLLASHDESLARELRSLRSVSSAVLSLGYRRSDVAEAHPLDGFGFVVPHTEGRGILACTWSSTKFPNRAPNDLVLLRAFVGGDAQEQAAELDDRQIDELVRGELSSLMGIRSTPVARYLQRWPKGNPQYDVGHLDRVDRIDERLRHLPGIFLAGCAYRGIGIPDCIRSARNAVDALLPYLTSRPTRRTSSTK